MGVASEYSARAHELEGYVMTYHNKGAHQGAEDAVYEGGKIVVHRIPATGEKGGLPWGWIAFGACFLAAGIHRRGKQNA